MKGMMRTSMILLLTLAVLTPGQALAANGGHSVNVDTDDYAFAVVGGALALGGLIWWAVHSARKKKRNANQNATAGNLPKPKLQLLIDIQHDPVPGAAAASLNLEPTYVVGATYRF